ncbi:hypothetical protein SAMN05421543_11597 [Alicyclobacillus macrosporangiidus]|uniref:Uncharacterized protein n=1 Tax=Alicyclobacillus macrosporangiidus TaxID=392015 RepID=A0A1I7KF97_9BACL|nr:hypothetical protein SAMN05421543_11597 [Alicyclobacillus macrosporangiidus]
MDKLIRWLSLLFSVYSPIYDVMASLQWLLLRGRGKLVLAVGTFIITATCLYAPASVRTSILLSIAVVIMMTMILQTIWTWAMNHRTLSLLVVCPLHPALRSRIHRATGIELAGDLYEVHVSPRKVKELLHDQKEIVRRTRQDAEIITHQCLAAGRPFAITGVTYTDAFGRVGYRAVKHLLKEVYNGAFPIRFGQRLLYPGKSWSVFIWTNRELVSRPA